MMHDLNAIIKSAGQQFVIQLQDWAKGQTDTSRITVIFVASVGAGNATLEGSLVCSFIAVLPRMLTIFRSSGC